MFRGIVTLRVIVVSGEKSCNVLYADYKYKCGTRKILLLFICKKLGGAVCLHEIVFDTFVVSSVYIF